MPFAAIVSGDKERLQQWTQKRMIPFKRMFQALPATDVSKLRGVLSSVELALERGDAASPTSDPQCQSSARPPSFSVGPDREASPSSEDEAAAEMRSWGGY